ncbi:MAG: bis(5'-nucleosyl)-tetraphosphatase (symmetrical) YqeK [Ethanoligenens sp.]
MDTERFLEILNRTLSEKRYFHSLMVSKAAEELAKRYGGDVQRAAFAGLVHDIAKEMKPEAQLQTMQKYSILLDDVERVTPKLWHAIAGYALLKYEYGVTDEMVLDAVRWHTTGRKGMPVLSKIVYLADCISEDRDFPGVEEVRAAAGRSLDDGYLEMLNRSIEGLLHFGALLHMGTVEARNELLLTRRDVSAAI